MLYCRWDCAASQSRASVLAGHLQISDMRGVDDKDAITKGDHMVEA